MIETASHPVETQAGTHVCHHCGTAMAIAVVQADGYDFCCRGCATVYDILKQGELCQYYALEPGKRETPGSESVLGERYDYLSSEEMVRQVAHFFTPNHASVTLHIPAMHCAACLYLLENLGRLEPALLGSRVDFIRKEVTLDWNPAKASLKEIMLLLCRIGYEPLINPGAQNVATEGHRRYMRGLVMRLGVTGFCAGNIMLFSFPDYLGIGSEPELLPVFTAAKVILTLPVVFFGASEYLKGAWQALRHRQLSLDVPLALGILTLFVRSLADTLITSGPGFYDSLAGLVLFLLAGRWVQARSFDHLRFDQTLDDFFPLAATVLQDGKKRYQKADTLAKGQSVEVQSNMLVPADGLLLDGPALIDYSFATGESRPALVHAGEQVFAGGRLQGKAVRVEVERPLSRSRFTHLWSHKAFDKKDRQGLVQKIERYFTAWFTWVTLGLAAMAALYWSLADASMVWPAATAVLIVACPCALSLAMPFATHAAMQSLARFGVFLRKPEVLQELAGLDAIVFDKTGTLTEPQSLEPTWEGEPLGFVQKALITWMASQSAHPLAKAISKSGPAVVDEIHLRGFEEIAGQGLQAIWALDTYRLGNPSFASLGLQPDGKESSRVDFSCNGHALGSFIFHHAPRAGMQEMFAELSRLNIQKSIVSGDVQAEEATCWALMGEGDIQMESTPVQKLEYLERLKASGLRTAMVGDGMNDAGAFAAAHVGIAVREGQTHFTPACDVILEASMVRHLPKVIRYARRVMAGVVIGFIISLLFNALSLGFAVTGQLSAAMAALLMPLGSLTVVLTSIGLARRASLAFERSIIEPNQGPICQ